jgi:hypothetical protein
MTSNHSTGSTASAGVAAQGGFARALSTGGEAGSRRGSLMRNLSSTAMRRISSSGNDAAVNSAADASSGAPGEGKGSIGTSSGKGGTGAGASKHGLQVRATKGLSGHGGIPLLLY